MTIDPAIQRAWEPITAIVADNAARVIHAFSESGLTAPDLAGTAGYGYDDRGRERLDRLVARLFGAEAALVRSQWASGTHVLTTVLRGLLRPGDTLWIAGGPVYDTLNRFLYGPGRGCLPDLGVTVATLGLSAEGAPDWSSAAHQPGPTVVYAQRSRGYQERPAWGPAQLAAIADQAHRLGATVVVDNCYGEFTETEEPTHWGADLAAGSLLKNPGGGIAPTGGYVAGRRHLVEQVADALFAPSLGLEIGPTGSYQRLMAQGWFMAPTLVGEALMGAIYARYLFDRAGYRVSPAPGNPQHDIVTAIDVGSAERVMRFCRAVQAVSPVDAMAHPEPWRMPGYDHEVIMAAGGFVPGGSLELSADAPLRPPYRVYLQGGLSRWHAVLAADAALAAL
ncbi:MAG: methionine gamma-lyase family protein [Thermaerobacter sp.]|nr:methionine gamma-lyase family protein [Thermaerobacter sp.]